jgi:peptide/nickel transport system permease protein
MRRHSIVMSCLLKLARGCGTLLVLSGIIYVLMNFKAPEDIARSVLGRMASQQQLRMFVQDNALNRPLGVRYLSWAERAFSGDLGVSLVTGRPVTSQVVPRVLSSLLIGVPGAMLGIIVGVTLGALLANCRGSAFDTISMSSLIVLASLPEFLLAMALYLTFVVWLRLMPGESVIALSFGTPKERLLVYVLPSLTISMLIIPQVTRMARATLGAAQRTPHVAAAHLRGLSPHSVYWGYTFRTALPSLLNVIGLNLIYATTGIVAVEYAFSFQGVGTYLINAIGTGDTASAEAIILLLAAVIILINALIDLLGDLLDPRLRRSE